MSVTWRDQGLDKILADVRKLGKVELVTGVVGEAAEEMHAGTDITVGELATIQELGTRDGHIPARPFVGGTAKQQRNNLIAWMRQAAVAVISGKQSPDRALDQVGVHLENAIKDAISNDQFVANAPSTISHKGFDYPLLESGEMIRAIGHYQRVKGAIDAEGNFVVDDSEGGDE